MPFVEAELVVTLTAPAAGLGGKLPSVWEAFGEPAQSLDLAQQTFQAANEADDIPALLSNWGGSCLQTTDCIHQKHGSRSQGV